MGRQFRPIRVHQIASRMLESGRLKHEPAWYRVVGAIPPSTSLVRPLPVKLQVISHAKSSRRTSNLFRPQKIVYPEDELRKKFYKDHPWELARPRIVLEDDGLDYTRHNWANMRQPGKALDGESVIQRQLYLMEMNSELGTREAYDIARKEFYQLRMQEDIGRRIAVEEALSVGAEFDKYYVDIMLEREAQVLADWKVKAAQDLALRTHRRNAAYSTTSLEEDMSVSGGAAAAAGDAEAVAPAAAPATAAAGGR